MSGSKSVGENVYGEIIIEILGEICMGCPWRESKKRKLLLSEILPTYIIYWYISVKSYNITSQLPTR